MDARSVHELERLLRHRFDEDLKAVLRVKELLDMHDLLGRRDGNSSAATAQPVNDYAASGAARGSLFNEVKSAFLDYPEKAWTCATIESYLRERGFQFRAKRPRSSISGAISRLIAKGLVCLVQHGSGRRAGLYRATISGLNDGKEAGA